MLSSSVVPVSTQMVAPLSSLACATLSAFFTMKASPVKKLLAPVASPSSVLRVSVSVESRMRTSISPDCSTEKRTFEVVPMNFTLSALPSTAVASARQ